MNPVLVSVVAPLLRGLSFDGTSGAIISVSTEAHGRSAASGSHEPDAAERATLDLGRIGDEDLTSAYHPSDALVARIASAYRACCGARREPPREATATDSAGVVHRFELRASAARGVGVREAPVAGRIAVVTGGAQGFGEGLVRSLADAGAFVWIADLNATGAEALSAELNRELGDTRVRAVAVNVSDESSVAGAVEQIVAVSGGIDLFVSNAGVLRAGSVMEMAAADFGFVTSVNYTGFFLCSKFASQVMALQNRGATVGGRGPYFTDIVQINSKSGLEGSNKNGAYAGSKFGGIGLVQSFAMELVTDNIKVNAICPGNFFEGPLWSDPDRGLFVQYLRAGKVPGATTVEDVKRFYEAKVPMNRGCRAADVVRALFYLVEQQYETGQALPVTGGQVMLN